MNVVVALFVVTGHIMVSCAQLMVNLRLMEFLRWVGWGWVGWVGVQSHFHVQPNYSVEVLLCCVVVVTIVSPSNLFNADSN